MGYDLPPGELLPALGPPESGLFCQAIYKVILFFSWGDQDPPLLPETPVIFIALFVRLTL